MTRPWEKRDTVALIETLVLLAVTTGVITGVMQLGNFESPVTEQPIGWSESLATASLITLVSFVFAAKMLPDVDIFVRRHAKRAA